MKKNLLIIIILAAAINANAQQKVRDSISNSYKKEFLLNPLPFLVGGFEIGYGIITKKVNIRTIAGYYFSERPSSYNENFKNLEGFRLDFQHLFLKPTDDDSRLYGGPFATFKTISMEKKESFSSSIYQPVKGQAISFGLIIGIRHFVSSNIFFDLHMGGGPTISLNQKHEEDVHIDIVNPYKRSINPRVGLTLGYAF